ATRRGIDHESSVRYVISKPGPVVAEDVTADNFSLLLRNVGASPFREPVGHRLFARRVRIVNKSVARRDGGAKNLPDGVAIAIVGFANDQVVAGNGRFHRNNNPPSRRKSRTRCHEKLRYVLACPKQPQLTSSPRALATMLATINKVIRPVTRNTLPR